MRHGNPRATKIRKWGGEFTFLFQGKTNIFNSNIFPWWYSGPSLKGGGTEVGGWGKGEGEVVSWLSGEGVDAPDSNRCRQVLTWPHTSDCTVVFFRALCRCDMPATAASEQPIMESAYVADTVHWYSLTPCRISSWAEMEVTGSATQTIRVYLAATAWVRIDS